MRKRKVRNNLDPLSVEERVGGFPIPSEQWPTELIFSLVQILSQFFCRLNSSKMCLGHVLGTNMSNA